MSLEGDKFPAMESGNTENNEKKDDAINDSFKALGLKVNENGTEDGRSRKISFADHPTPSSSSNVPVVSTATNGPVIQEEQDQHQHQHEKDSEPHRRDYSDARSIHTHAPSQYRNCLPYNSDAVSSTRSLYSSDYTYEQVADRRYSPNYFMPNDETEQTRMGIIHNVFYFLLDKRVCTVPLVNPSMVLDVGTGTGDWAINVAEDYPNCEVVGMDIAHIQSTAVPHNVFFEIYDAEDEAGWTYPPDSFDLVHFRNMKGCFTDWRLIYERSFAATKPGGYIELIEFGEQLGFESYFKEESAIHAWFQALRETAATNPKSYNVKFLSEESLKEAGYINIKSTEIKIPLGDWAKDENMRRVSRLWLVSCIEGLEALSLRTLVEVKGWKVEEVRQVCRSIGKELLAIARDKEKAKGFGIAVNILIGRKPGFEGDESASDPLIEIGDEVPMNEARERKAVAMVDVATDHMASLSQQQNVVENGN